jgi:hypothetical protein
MGASTPDIVRYTRRVAATGEGTTEWRQLALEIDAAGLTGALLRKWAAAASVRADEIKREGCEQRMRQAGITGVIEGGHRKCDRRRLP